MRIVERLQKSTHPAVPDRHGEMLRIASDLIHRFILASEHVLSSTDTINAVTMHHVVAFATNCAEHYQTERFRYSRDLRLQTPSAVEIGIEVEKLRHSLQTGGPAGPTMFRWSLRHLIDALRAESDVVNGKIIPRMTATAGPNRPNPMTAADEAADATRFVVAEQALQELESSI